MGESVALLDAHILIRLQKVMAHGNAGLNTPLLSSQWPSRILQDRRDRMIRKHPSLPSSQFVLRGQGAEAAVL